MHPSVLEENVEILFLALVGSFVSSQTLLMVVFAPVTLSAHGGVDLRHLWYQKVMCADGTMRAD